MMSRFLEELNGMRGEYWQKEAVKELNRVRGEYERGEITIDDNGVARNCLNRVLASDMVEKLMLITDKVSKEATERAEDAEIAEIIRNARKHRVSAEERAEVRAAFGEGVTMVNVITGERWRT